MKTCWTVVLPKQIVSLDSTERHLDMHVFVQRRFFLVASMSVVSLGQGQWLSSTDVTGPGDVEQKTPGAKVIRDASTQIVLFFRRLDLSVGVEEDSTEGRAYSPALAIEPRRSRGRRSWRRDLRPAPWLASRPSAIDTPRSD